MTGIWYLKILMQAVLRSEAARRANRPMAL